MERWKKTKQRIWQATSWCVCVSTSNSLLYLTLREKCNKTEVEINTGALRFKTRSKTALTRVEPQRGADGVLCGYIAVDWLLLFFFFSFHFSFFLSLFWLLSSAFSHAAWQAQKLD